MLQQLLFVGGIGAFIALSISVPIVISYFVDRKAHDGVDWFRRRAIRSRGEAADATVLSSTILTDRATGGSKYSGAYSIVYEVRPRSGAPTFRKQAIEVMYFSEARANLAVGQVVQVRFDPADQTVVLVRIGREKIRDNRDAERREKEERLLRGG